MLAAATAVANDEYACGPCAAANGRNESYLEYFKAWNESGDGICAEGWWQDAEGEYHKEAKECNKSGEKTTATSPCRFYGHGEARRYYMAYEYFLYGEQFQNEGGSKKFCDE